MKLSIDLAATDGAARTGTITTPRGVLPTPLFMPVGTRAAVKTLTPDDLHQLDVPLILGNTYHLMLKPGADLMGRPRGACTGSWRGTATSSPTPAATRSSRSSRR